MTNLDNQSLMDREAIKELKARYFRYVDTKQWKLLRSLFVDCAFFDISLAIEGPDQFITFVIELLEHAVSVHHGHTPEIKFLDAERARAVWQMFDWVEYRVKRADGTFGWQGWGYYEDEYVRDGDGQWRISILSIRRIRVDPIFSPRLTRDSLLQRDATDWLRPNQ